MPSKPRTPEKEKGMDKLREKVSSDINNIIKTISGEDSLQNVISKYIISKKCLKLLAPLYEVDKDKLNKIISEHSIFGEFKNLETMFKISGQFTDFFKALSQASIVKVREK